MKSATMSPTLLAVLIVGCCALILGILIGHYATPTAQTSKNASKSSIFNRYTQNYFSGFNDSDPVYRALIDNVSLDNIRKNVRFLASEPHTAGSARDKELADFYVESFKKFGMDRVHMTPYKVLLSQPDLERENSVYVLDKSTMRIVHSTKTTESLLRPEDQFTLPAYNAYSPKADVSGSVVYVNYGTEQDFEMLQEDARIVVKDQICLIRLGRMHRGNKLANAAKAGCAGVLLFSDPEKVAPLKTITAGQVYPHSIWMNGEAMQRGNARLGKGDPLSAGFPAVNEEGVYFNELNDPSVKLPTIPCQPIGYNDARVILENMDGPDAAQIDKFRSWRGALNCTYRLSSENNRIVRMVTNNKLESRVIYNVIAILDGELEPDRYVIVGNHRDAWGVGAMDAVTGSAPMLESARIFGELKQTHGWRPRRSLVFASWSGEEQGIIGSYEFVEEHLRLLQSNAVAYINIDTCVKGADIDIEAWPTLMDVSRRVFKRIPAHKRNQFEDKDSSKNESLHDNWLIQLKEEKKFVQGNNKPPVKLVGSGSDHAPFAFYANIPAIDFTFKPVNGTIGASYPAYHTAYETLYLLETFVDPNYEIHRSCSRVISMFLYELSSTTLVGMNFEELSQVIETEYQKTNVSQILTKALAPHDSSKQTEFLENSMNSFFNQTRVWQKSVERIQANQSLLSDPYLIRFVNDVSSQVHRVFSTESSLSPSRPDTKNLLFAPPSFNSYTVVLFPGIVDMSNQIEQLEKTKTNTANYDEVDEYEAIQEQLRIELKRHLNLISFAFRSATTLLREKQL